MNAFDLAVQAMAERKFIDTAASEYVTPAAVADLCFNHREASEAFVDISPRDAANMGAAIIKRDLAELGLLVDRLLTEYTERVVNSCSQQRHW